MRICSQENVDNFRVLLPKDGFEIHSLVQGRQAFSISDALVKVFTEGEEEG